MGKYDYSSRLGVRWSRRFVYSLIKPRQEVREDGEDNEAGQFPLQPDDVNHRADLYKQPMPDPH